MVAPKGLRDMFQIVYASQAAVPFTPADLAALLSTARTLNRKHGVTGMLVFSGGRFLQALEGDAQSVISTFGRITRDARHRNVTTLHRGMSYLGKTFGDWAMGFHEAASAQDLPAGFVRVNNQIDLSQFDGAAAVEFLAECQRHSAAA